MSAVGGRDDPNEDDNDDNNTQTQTVEQHIYDEFNIQMQNCRTR